MMEALSGFLPKQNDTPALRTKPVEKNHKENFDVAMDRAVSEQRALTRDLEQDQSKKLEKTISQVKESLKAMEKTGVKDSKSLENLKELTQYTEKILNEDTELSPLLEALVENLLQFLVQAQIELDQNGVLGDSSFYMAENFSFVLEGLIQDISSNTLSLAQKNIITDLSLQAQTAANKSLFALIDKDIAIIDDIAKTESLLAKEELPKELVTDEKSGAFSEKDGNPKNTEKSLITVQDSRMSLKMGIKENIIEAKFSQMTEPKDDSPAAPPLNSIPSRLENFIQKSEVVFSSPALKAQVETMMLRLSARAVFTLSEGNSEFRMKLTPPELGQMKISFRLDDGIMQGKIVVSTPEAKALFEENMNMLKESLSKAGVTIAHVDVSLGSQSDFSETDSSLENNTEQFKAIRTPAPKISEIISRSLGFSEIDYTA